MIVAIEDLKRFSTRMKNWNGPNLEELLMSLTEMQCYLDTFSLSTMKQSSMDSCVSRTPRYIALYCFERGFNKKFSRNLF